MNNKPNKWLAALLNLFSQPLGMLYVAQPVWAAIYLVALWTVAALYLLGASQHPGAFSLLLLAFYVAGPVHAFWLAARYPADKPRPHYSRWYGLVAAAAGFFAVLAGFRAFFYEPFTAPSGSMLPTIVPRSLVAVQKLGYGHYTAFGIPFFRGGITSDLHRGDIVVFDFPGDASIQFIKRLIALPGDKVTYRDKVLAINGVEIRRSNGGEYHFARPDGFFEQLARFNETLDGSDYSVIEKDGVPPILAAPDNFPFRDRCVYDDRGLTCEVPAGHYFMMGDNRDNSRDSRYWGFVPASNIVGKVVYVR